jgi:NAD(P)-dependent dehydrogenase (short-subunit alcohol dehydrogenase family)
MVYLGSMTPTSRIPSVLVTGGSAGIGGQISVSLARAGYEVFFAGRDPDRGRALQDRITDGGDRARFIRADLSTQDGVARLAGDLRADLAARGHRGLDALVNNLGGVAEEGRPNADGVETTFASNFVHPLLLASLLLPELEAAGGRVVQMSTGYHHLVRLRPRDLDGRRWDCGMNVYGRAKLLSVQAGEVVGRRWAARGVGWHFADPGMAETPLTRSMGPRTFPWYGRFLMPVVKRVQRPIPLTWCASSTLRLLTRRDLPAPYGVYVLPGPLILPRPLVGFDPRAGARNLEFSYRWFLPPYRSLVESSTRA